MIITGVKNFEKRKAAAAAEGAIAKKYAHERGAAAADCISFYWDKGGRPECSALMAAYCMAGGRPCPFQLTHEEAARGRFAENAARIAPHL